MLHNRLTQQENRHPPTLTTIVEDSQQEASLMCVGVDTGKFFMNSGRATLPIGLSIIILLAPTDSWHQPKLPHTLIKSQTCSWT